MTNTCPSCGAAVDSMARVCRSCGYQFNHARRTMPATATMALGTIVRSARRAVAQLVKYCQLVVLCRDKSPSMCGNKDIQATRAGNELVGALAMPINKDGFHVGMVDFSGSARIVRSTEPATTFRSPDLIPGICGVFSSGTNITDGLAKAHEIVLGFVAPADRVPLRPVVILFTDGGHNTGPDPEPKATELKMNADLVTVAFGDDAEEYRLRALATSPEHFCRCSNGEELRRFLAKLGTTMSGTLARGINATQALARACTGPQ